MKFQICDRQRPQIGLVVLPLLGLIATLSACRSTPPPVASETLQAKVEVGTIQGLQQGDRACYASVADAGGNVTQQFASVELCGQSALVGQSMRLFYEPVSIAAESCQGNPSCTATETVLSIVRTEPLTANANPAPAPPVQTTQPTQTAAAPPVQPAPAAPAAPAPAAPAPAAQPAPKSLGAGQYMGVAATGEEVYYGGMTLQCGDLPDSDPCWRSPSVNYTIGNDSVLGIADCDRQVFREVWVGSEMVAQDMAPQSEAIAKVISLACYDAVGL